MTGTHNNHAFENETERNKSVARRYFEEFVDGRRLDVLDEIVAADAADETRVGAGGTGTREHAEWLWENVEDVHVSDLLAEGDRVIVFWTIEGLHTGNIFGVPATGKPFTGQSISWLTVREGRIVRYNVLPDRLGIIQQLANTHSP
ncbi:ester cyclase [Streptomyces hokutonensis]|uniref:ester cyclase n=1 Tax=Streptomyces hokutonensis TaxID=1306990 RepID=UPI00036F998F|nr:ester cyclase [Streptomyces hokutonensis]